MEEFNGAKALVGFHEPTPAKLLYRTRRGLEHDKWPSEGFKDASLASYQLLEALLDCCLHTIVKDCWGLAFDRTHGGLCCIGKDGEIGPVEDQTELAGCPMDYFLYSNDDRVASVENCSAHKDRGLLSVVVCSEVPGLLVNDVESEDWLAIEVTCEPAL